MEKISELIKIESRRLKNRSDKPLPTVNISNESERRENHEAAMVNLWGLMTIELGSAFCRQYGNAGSPVFNIWLRELNHFTKEELVAGLESFKKSGSTYMSLNIFRKHCQPKAKGAGVISDEKAQRVLLEQKKLHAGISEESKKRGKATLNALLNKSEQD
jgi:hypothetical protein